MILSISLEVGRQLTSRIAAKIWVTPHVLAALLAPLLYGHQQPTTLAVLDIGSGRVDMNLHVPLPELQLAFGHEVTQRPEQSILTWGPAFRNYLTGHIHPTTAKGDPWSVRVLTLTVGRAEQTQSGPFQEVLVQLVLEPPAGASLRDFVLNYDVIMHQVVTHKALVSVHNDWASGRVEPAQVGVIAVNTTTARIEPLAIHLGEGSLWKGFQGMLSLGMQHIREGTDHLLFLLVLLLPATLRVNGNRWGEFGAAVIV